MMIAAEIENLVLSWAKHLLLRQVACPQPVAALEDLKGRAALRCGRRFDIGAITQNPRNPNLFKVGVEGDTELSPDSWGKTQSARKAQTSTLGVGSKLRRYILSSTPGKFSRIYGYGFGKIRDLVFPPPRGAHGDTAWAGVRGVNFQRLGDGRFLCIDHGGIYEDLLTTPASRFPSQVATDLYTTSNAAYLFDWNHKRDPGTSDWAEARTAAGLFLERFHSYPRQRLEFDHREFDYAAVKLTFGNALASKFDGWSRYDPVNVFGLRWDNLTLGAGHGWRRRAMSALIRWTVAANQTKDGLISDNFRGRVVNSADLTYHQYCLALLCLGNVRPRSPVIDRVIRRALAFSLSRQLGTGEVSYYGRGANNIYHLSAFAAACCYAAGILGWDVRDALARAVGRLAEHQRNHPQDVMPTAMNAECPPEMVGWHGSAAQYGAQSAFLLARALPLLDVDPVRSENPAFTIEGQTGHGIIGTAGLQLAVTAGADLIPWNQGQHVTGFSGISALVWSGRNLALTNEEAMQADGRKVLVSDIQGQSAHSRSYLKITGSDHAALEVRDKDGSRSISYQIAGDALTLAIAAPGRQASHSLPLQGTPRIEIDGPRHLKITGCPGVIIEVEASAPITSSLTAITNNCQGRGGLITLSAQTRDMSLTYRFLPQTAASRQEAESCPALI